jgi:hypothetical protein
MFQPALLFITAVSAAVLTYVPLPVAHLPARIFALHAPAPCTPDPSSSVRGNAMTANDTTLLAIYESGLPYAKFLDAVDSRREGWVRHSDSANVDPALVTRARAVTGKWKLMIVAVDACNDSMNSVPFVVRMLDSVPTVEVRIVSPEKGASVQQSHKTMDGRAATPTFVLLDASGKEQGCIVELPRELRHATFALRTAGKIEEAQAGKRAFYEQNKGRAITAEVVEMLESAAAGKPLCERAP